MSKLFHRIYRRGFTLIELMVVIAIIAILVAILVPAVSNALLSGKLTQIMTNGKNIYTALFAKEMEGAVFMQTSPYPRKGALDVTTMTFPDSTEYFRWVVTGGVMNVEFSYFAAPDVLPALGTNPANFTAINNAWCVTAGIGEGTADGTPMFFTRNLQKIENLGDLTPTKGNLTDFLPKNKSDGTANFPFQDKAVVIIYKGGSALAPHTDNVKAYFNRLEATNGVLRPGTGY